jgi:hypothetical protein
VHQLVNKNFDSIKMHGTTVKITASDANQPERIQRMFAALCLNPFFSHIPYNYTFALQLMKLHTLRVRRHHLELLEFIIS